MLDSVRHGMSRREIATRHGISTDGVRYHVRNIAGKLGVAGTPELRHWPGYPASSPLHTTRMHDMPDTASTVSMNSIGQISLLCRSVERTEAFYRDSLGLRHQFTFGDLAFFGVGGTRLFLRAVADEEWRAGSIIYFRVDDIREAHRLLSERGAPFSGAPHMIHRHESGAEEWMAFFDDPDGNTLALMAQVQPG